MADEQQGIVNEGIVLTGGNEPQMQLLKEQLSQARRLEAIGLASGVVAHDINNLLTPILGYSTILKRELPEDHPLAAGVASIERAAERAARLIHNLLESSQQVGQQKIPVDVSALVSDLVEDLSPRITEQVDIQLKIHPDIPPVIGDPSHLARMLRNLTENALEAMSNGGIITIQAEAVTLDDGFCKRHPGCKHGLHVCLTVADSGHGIPAEIKSRIFEPFFSTKPVLPGIGMGLTLARSIIKSHAGALEVQSVECEGTTIRVYLPAVSVE